MTILGITHPISLNSAACLLKDDKLLAFAEEERFVRIKHAPQQVPNSAIDYCLHRSKISLKDIDFIAIGYDSFFNIIRNKPLQRIKELFGAQQIEAFSAQNKDTNSKPSVFSFARDFVILYYQGFSNLPFSLSDKRIVFVRHHLAHSASTFFCSGFKKANIISLDAGGGQEAGFLASGEDNQIKVIKEIPHQSSWGQMYAILTEFLGFERYDGEGKVMGLAAYGKPNQNGLPFVDLKRTIPAIDQKAFAQFLKKERSRKPGTRITKKHQNLAATLQYTLEETAIKMARFLYETNGISDFCVAGGVGLNCLMNKKLLDLPFVDRLFIQPVANDAGTALGAALWLYSQRKKKRPKLVFDHVYWGPEFFKKEIKEILEKSQTPYFKKFNNIAKVTAKLLAQDRVVGWFQGRMEVGPRALGNRSILANPKNPKIKDIVNKKVKNREPWRPFAPSILEEYASDYLVSLKKSPFMILSDDTTEKRREIISAIHIDNTCRPQTVSKKTNPRYWQLIDEFRKITGVPAVLNTSFNLRSEPIICTPQDALSTFYRSGLDFLVLGDYLVSKKEIAKKL